MTAGRSLADVVRALDPASVEHLLRLRPDLAQPRPLTLEELAERAASPTSARLAIDRLTAWQRRVAVALAASPEDISSRRLAALLQADRPAVEAAVAHLARVALAWGSDRGWRLTSGARQAIGPYPAGLAPESPSPLSDTEIDAALERTGDDVRRLLQRLVWDTPVGQVRDADRRGEGDSPADRALAARLLRPRDPHTAILPREVSLRLRGGRLFEHPLPTTVPGWPASEGPNRRADQAGLGAAFELIRVVEQTVDDFGLHVRRPLTSGGLSRKDLAAVAASLGNPGMAVFVLQLCRAAGLLANDGRAWLPTVLFDRWAESPDRRRWRTLLDAYAGMSAWPDAGALLTPGEDIGWAGPMRALVLDQLGAASPGTPVDAGLLAERIAWLRPPWDTEDLASRVARILEELNLLGVVAFGRRTALADPGHQPDFPDHVDHIIIQSDLTAVSPGPLTREVASTLGLLAERESVGGAGVHRFTGGSVRRALDAGWNAESIREWITRHSDTGLPQPLAYLIDDVARRHGAVQVSAVASVITVDDPVTAEALLNDARARPLGLRRIAGGVLGALAEPEDVVAVLRQLGHAPIARDASGEPATAPASLRARLAPLGATERTPVVDLHRLAEDLVSRENPDVLATSAQQIVDVLAAHQGTDTWLEVDRVLDDGSPSTSLARVMGIASGNVRLQQRAAPAITVALSRIVAVRTSRPSRASHPKG
ncbi:MAG TPA: helicase-associated domain-containing protein [Propionibacteriaceae bacterium]|nr:helicase-associated domain-containing protein [Propionibacteriaceae bacterium]